MRRDKQNNNKGQKALGVTKYISTEKLSSNSRGRICYNVGSEVMILRS